MRFVNFYRRPISMLVMVTFTILLCFWANQTPAASTAPASEKSQGAALENSNDENTNFVEKEEPAPAIKKGKKFPWLIVALVAVAGGAALYFVLLKKTKYELTVTLGAGTTGTPATSKYEKGEVVPYSFSTQPGYANLHVMLDVTEVAATGSVTMDKAHTLTTSATQGSGLQVNSTPSGARIYLDNVDSGFVTPHAFSFATAVTKTVRLHYSCEYREHTQTVSVNLGQTITINPTLAAGVHEDFNAPVSSCWNPYYADSWSTGGGVYKYKGAAPKYSLNFYNFPLSGDYTLTVRMNRRLGLMAPTGLFLAETMSMTNAKGYYFTYSPHLSGGSYQVRRMNGFNFTDNSGFDTYIKGGYSIAVNKGLNNWNTIKIIKAGANYTFKLNGFIIHSFNDATYTQNFFTLLFFCGTNTTEILYEYVYLDI